MKKDMHRGGGEFVPSDVEAVGLRNAAWWKRRHPKDTQKKLAAEMDIALDTAKKWLAGVCPQSHHLVKMMGRFGREYMAEIFEPLDPGYSQELSLRADMRAHIREAEKLAERMAKTLEGGN